MREEGEMEEDEGGRKDGTYDDGGKIEIMKEGK